MGTISGSSIANTVTTGAFTIPLMKRSGYSPEFAGGVESSASSGGRILPPVMGAAAFLIVQYTATPFADVIIVATIPAIVFFFGVWVMVHFEASRVGIGGLDPADLVKPRAHLRTGWFYLVPILLLLYYLIVERLLGRPLGLVHADRHHGAHRARRGLQRRDARPPSSPRSSASRCSRSPGTWSGAPTRGRPARP